MYLKIRPCLNLIGVASYTLATPASKLFIIRNLSRFSFWNSRYIGDVSNVSWSWVTQSDVDISDRRKRQSLKLRYNYKFMYWGLHIHFIVLLYGIKVLSFSSMILLMVQVRHCSQVYISLGINNCTCINICLSSGYTYLRDFPMFLWEHLKCRNQCWETEQDEMPKISI